MMTEAYPLRKPDDYIEVNPYQIKPTNLPKNPESLLVDQFKKAGSRNMNINTDDYGMNQRGSTETEMSGIYY